MTDTTQNFAVEYVPTRAERFWHWVGFHYHLGDEPEGIDGMPGWMCTGIRLNFTWPDRLRLLLTGRLRIRSVVHHDTPSATVCKSRIDWHIKFPGERE